ncbi:MAG: hypothetical protein ACRYF2_26510 [Janthinobacterium lividum]
MTPLRTIQLAGYPLRIYASPLTVPDHPWASFHDLMTLAEMDEVDQPRWLDKLRQELPEMVHDLPDGTVIVAEPMVGGMFQALDMMGLEDMQEMRDEWTEAWMELFAIQLAEMPGDTWEQAAREAELRNVPNMRGKTVLQ